MKFRPHEIEAAARVFRKISSDLRIHHRGKQLLQVAGTNEYALKTIFRNVFKTSMYQHRITERMTFAKSELITTNKLVAEIADELGYGNPEYFSRCFKKIVGVSPSAFRKQNNKD